MTPEQLFDVVSAVLLKSPPQGLDRRYIRGFLERNRSGMLAVIRRQFERVCRPDALIKTYEQKLGFAVLPVEASPQQAVFGRDIGQNPTVFLAVKARCHPIDPVRARQYAVHARRADEKTWRIHEGEEWHPSEEDAVSAFVLAHAHEARWLVNEKDENWSGFRNAPYVLAEARAVAIAQERYAELKEESDREERARARLRDNLETWQRQHPRRAPAPTPTSSVREPSAPEAPQTTPHPVQPSSPSVVTPIPQEVEPVSEVTPWGGARGAELPGDTVQKGMRVVTFRGEHGVVDKVEVTTWRIAGMRFGQNGVSPENERDERSYSFRVRLDSGRLDFQNHLFAELSRPTAVVPDVDISDRHDLKSPADAWRDVVAHHRAITLLQEKSANARKPLIKAQHLEQSKEARVKFERIFRRFHMWRTQNPHVRIEDGDPLMERILTLEAGIRNDGWEVELRWLRAVPKDWRTRFQVGDGVVRHSATGGQVDERRDRIVSIEGTDAILESDGSRVPLFQLRPAPDQVLEVPTYGKGLWLAELGQDMLAPRLDHWGKSVPAYVERAAVARAIKSYLADQGIDVRTQVETGANMNGVVLRPGADRWSSSEVEQMNELLPGLGADPHQARFHPTVKEGTPGDPMTDYYGTPSGIWLEPERIPAFAPYLARALQDAGQALSRNGEAWLAKQRTTQVRLSATNEARSGATTEQRAAAAGGCIDMTFTMPAFGLIRVVCSNRGRRDVWQNIYINQARYGFNGGRWARGVVPPAEVLEELRRRGITAFSTEERLEEPDAEDHLDPVVAELVQNGGLRSDLLPEIAEELRPKARAIPGFLRKDGKGWLELARLHYNEPGVMVVETYPADAWKHPDVMYETPDSYAELVNFSLDYSFPEVLDEHYEDEVVERLCSCQRPAAGLRRTG